jgi:hypothetical protein
MRRGIVISSTAKWARGFMLDETVEEKVAKGIHDLNVDAVQTLKDVLTFADSDDVKRKAAVDILNFSQVGKSKGKAPTVTEAQLEFLGRVIVEAEAVREGLALSKGSLV